MTTRFTVDDLRELSDRVQADWRAARELDWEVRAGSLEWSCRQTAVHVVDTMFAPAFFLASRRTDDYPGFGDIAAPDGIAVDDLADGLRGMTNILIAVIEHAPPTARAIIRRRPQVTTAPPGDFAPRGALECALHAHDIASGLGYEFSLEPGLAGRLRDHVAGWPLPEPPDHEPTGDPWRDLLSRFGRS